MRGLRCVLPPEDLMKRAAIKYLCLAILALTVTAAVPAYADEWSKTYSLTGNPDLRVETSDANIHVTTWDQNTIEAKVVTSRYKIGEGGIRVEESQNGNSVEINALPASQFQHRMGPA
jgi:hypothetical protein